MPTHITAKGRMPRRKLGRRKWRQSSRRSRCERVSTLTVVDSPGRSARSSGSLVSSATRTGTRCTILVKLPVAFSGGMTLKIAPVPGERLSTWPRKTWSGKHVGDDRRFLARRHMRELVFLEIGVDPKPMRRDDGDQIGASGDIGADLGRAIADVAVDGRADFRVAEVELGGAQIGLGFRDGGARFCDLRIDHVKLLARGVKRRLGGEDGRSRDRVRGQGLLRILLRAGACLRELPVAGVLLAW